LRDARGEIRRIRGNDKSEQEGARVGGLAEGGREEGERGGGARGGERAAGILNNTRAEGKMDERFDERRRGFPFLSFFFFFFFFFFFHDSPAWAYTGSDR